MGFDPEHCTNPQERYKPVNAEAWCKPVNTEKQEKPINPAFRRQRQKNQKFKTILGHVAILNSKVGWDL